MIDWLQAHPIFLSLISWFAGLIMALAGNYVKFAGDISFIRGQLSQILKTHDEFTVLVEKHAKLDISIQKLFKDLDGAYSRLKAIEIKILKDI